VEWKEASHAKDRGCVASVLCFAGDPLKTLVLLSNTVGAGVISG